MGCCSFRRSGLCEYCDIQETCREYKNMVGDVWGGVVATAFILVIVVVYAAAWKLIGIIN